VYLLSYPTHGANPFYLYEKFNTDMPKEIVDFSVNVNPFRPPYDSSNYQHYFEQWLTEYPDPELSSLKDVIGSLEQISNEQLFIGNGAAQCIFLLAQFFQRKTIGIIQPTFVEYKEASKLYGCEIKELVLTRENEWSISSEEIRQFLKEVDVLFICNPNNPTGTVLDQARMKEIIQFAKGANTYLIIDEAFYDFSSIPCTAVQEVNHNQHVIVLRSLTKMYKLAGIRIGYIVAFPAIIKEISPYSPPWSVNRFASELAIDALSNHDYAKDIQTKVKNERERVSKEIRSLGYYVSQSSVNFYLLSGANSEGKMDEFIQYLLSNGIVPRHTHNFIGLSGKYLRFALKDYESNQLLINHLKGWKEQC
jgi:threonine-phosphate decarboxylase